MKRFFVCFALMIAMVLTVGCNKKPELQWSQVSPMVNWNEAVDYCYNLREGGFDDWKVPDIDELRSLFVDCPATKIGGECQISEKDGKLSIKDYTDACKGCEIQDYGKFVGEKIGWYFSSSDFNGSQHWAMMLGTGTLDVGEPSDRGYVQCVRIKNPKKSSQELTWSNKSSRSMNWYQALTYCQNLKENNSYDWRLPNIDELRMLIKDRKTVFGGPCKVSEINNCLSKKCFVLETCGEGVDPQTRKVKENEIGRDGRYSLLGDTSSFWSSSTYVDDTHAAWFVIFDRGLVGPYSKSETNSVRCVRGEDKIHKLTLEVINRTVETIAPANPTDESEKQEPKNSGAIKELNWSEKASEKMFARDAIDYCENLSENGHNDWRLPTIGELRTLIQNCEGTETGGTCGVTDTCLSQNDCKNKACDGCEDKTIQYSKLGDKGLFWSSSFRPESSNNAWYIDFTYASVHGHSDGKKLVRCVRNAD